MNDLDFFRKIRLRHFVSFIVLQLHAKFWKDPMIGFREKLVTNGRTDERTDGSESIGPTSKVGGSNKKIKNKKAITNKFAKLGVSNCRN